jgi:anthranilate phosphoribosyltransferase
MTEHPFATYVRALGRGRHLSRPLEEGEAEAAMRLILAGAVEPVQLGAFLMLLRYRGETAAELAGFVRAARAHLGPAPACPVDLDWPSYADRHKQLPWFILAAALLAENGVKILMHGVAGESDGYAPTRPVLERLGIPVCRSLGEAAARLREENLVYVGLEHLCPPLQGLFDLRPLLGLRSAVNSLARALNPSGAPHQMQGVFHPPYVALHQETAQRLGQPHAYVFKGGGGEAQRNPEKPCRVGVVRAGDRFDEEWPAMVPKEGYPWREEPRDPERVAALWRGELDLQAPAAAAIGTAAMALRLMRRAESVEAAQAMAADLWARRPRAKYGRPLGSAA